MAVARYFSSISQPTALTGGVSNVNGSIQVQATTGFPTSYPFTLSVDYGTSAEELVDVTSDAGLTLNVTRGVDGTSAQSHSIGAVVRHVSSGRDFSDFQTHAAATAGVHGAAGTLVGTSDAQTLANKTLTSPSISGATLSGTLAGTPTFSGNAVFTGAPDFRGASTGASALGTRVSGDTTQRLIVSADGTHTWGPGNAAGDATLGRVGTLALRTSASLQANRVASTDMAYAAQISTDTVERWRVYADGKHEWGPGGAAARDVNLYRGGADLLQTDDSLTVGSTFTAGNFTSGAGLTWGPVWSTSTGLHLPTYGNAGQNSTYFRLGRQLFCYFQITFGSSTTFGTGVTTADNWNFSLPAGLTASATFAGTNVPCGFGAGSLSGSATAPFQVVVDPTGTAFQLNVSGGRVDGVALTNTGTADSLTPWTWISGNTLRFSASVEVTT